MNSLSIRTSRRSIVTIAATALLVLALGGSGPASAGAAPRASLPALEPAGYFDSAAGTRAAQRAQPQADSSSAFVYRTGRFIPLASVPGASLSQISGINDRGQITGIYLGADAVPGPDGNLPANSVKGFVQNRRGVVRALDLPFPYLHAVRGINDRGAIVGYYDTEDRTDGGGFLLHRSGAVTLIDIPGGSFTTPWGINDSGQIVGFYTKPDLTFGGFRREPDGGITRIEVPGASYTTPNDINDRGQIVGAYLDSDAAPNPDGTIPRNALHGFLWKDGRITRFDVPRSIYTQPFGINNRGQVSGGYYDAAGGEHGFLLSKGGFTTLDAPSRTGTLAVDINDRGDAVIPDPNTTLLPVASP
jgi:uncharacterized membrane protein